MQTRFVTGLFPSKNKPSSQAVFETDLSRRITRNDVSPVWAKLSTQDLRCSYELGRTIPASERYASNRLSGRFFTGPSKPSNASTTRQAGSRYPEGLGLDSKSREICVSSPKKPRIPRNKVGYLAEPKSSSRTQSPVSDCQDKSNASGKKDKPQGLAESSRTTKLCLLCSPQRTIKFSVPSQLPECFTDIEFSETTPITVDCTEQPKMVVNKLSEHITNSRSASIPLSNHRCVGFGMGRSNRQPGCLRNVVQTGADTALQSKRNASHYQRPKRSLSAPEGFHSSCTMRQQICSRLPQERGGHEIDAIAGSDLPGVSDLRSISDTSQSVSHSGQVQQPCRSPVQVAPASRVALVTQIHDNCVCQMGNACDRSFCLRKSSRCRKLRDVGPGRSPGSIPRCVLQSLEFPTCVDVPSTFPCTQGPGTFESGGRNLSSGSAQVGKSFLEGRTENTGSGSPDHHLEPRKSFSGHIDRPTTSECSGTGSRSVDVWGWSNELNDWSSEQVALLQSSWRSSTYKTYSVAWKRWVEWSTKKNIDCTNPTGEELARFLADLHLVYGLAYKTILVYKSVVATFCRTDVSGHLSSHALVKHVLKSIALKTPAKQKPPVWNTDDLVTFITNYSIDINNPFLVSRHTAILLLLSSGRRIHDLTLLDIDLKHCVRSDSSITFWPRFGSKTDSQNYRQSGWKLSMAPVRNLNPVFWINQLICILNDRRQSVNCYNLFITFRGDVKAASRALIAGWVKSLLVEANISATPGSIRSAVASRSWIDNYPLEEILSRGNWRSENTFKNFYRREVVPASSKKGITDLFNPIT